MTERPQEAYWAPGQKSSSCSTHDCDSLACKAWKRSISCSRGLASWQTCSLQIAGATERPLPAIVSYQSFFFDFRDIRRTSQGFDPFEIGLNRQTKYGTPTSVERRQTVYFESREVRPAPLEIRSLPAARLEATFDRLRQA